MIKFHLENEDTEARQGIILRLMKQGNGSANLQAKHVGAGGWYNLIHLTTDGEVFSFTYIPKEFGFELDQKGRLNIKL